MDWEWRINPSDGVTTHSALNHVPQAGLELTDPVTRRDCDENGTVIHT
jgi:hypothetical protein